MFVYIFLFFPDIFDESEAMKFQRRHRVRRSFASAAGAPARKAPIASSTPASPTNRNRKKPSAMTALNWPARFAGISDAHQIPLGSSHPIPAAIRPQAGRSPKRCDRPFFVHRLPKSAPPRSSAYFCGAEIVTQFPARRSDLSFTGVVSLAIKSQRPCLSSKTSIQL